MNKCPPKGRVGYITIYIICVHVQPEHVALVRWMENTRRAEEMSCELVVVTKPDGSLGRSQSGEVEFLRKSGYIFEERSVREFAEDVLTFFLADLRADGKSLRIRSPSRSRSRLPSLGVDRDSSDDEFAIELSSSNKRWPTDPQGLLLREQWELFLQASKRKQIFSLNADNLVRCS